MKKAILVLCLLVLVTQLAIAQAVCEIYKSGIYSSNSVTYMFGDQVNLRKEPKSADNVIGVLSIGQPVTVLEKSQTTLTLDGYEESWYKISTTDDKGKSIVGYVWGGMLAKTAFQVDVDNDGKKELVMAGINRTEPKDSRKLGDIKVVKDKKIISQCQFEPVEMNEGKSYYYSIKGIMLFDKGFTPKRNILQLEFEYQACDYTQGHSFFFIGDNSIVLGLTTYYASSEIGSTDYEYLFPNDKGGIANTLITKKILTEVEESGLTIVKTNIVNYLWKGDKLIKQ